MDGRPRYGHGTTAARPASDHISGRPLRGWTGMNLRMIRASLCAVAVTASGLPGLVRIRRIGVRCY